METLHISQVDIGEPELQIIGIINNFHCNHSYMFEYIY